MVSMFSYIFTYVCYIVVIVYHCWYSIRAEKKIFALEQKLNNLEINNKEDC